MSSGSGDPSHQSYALKPEDFGYRQELRRSLGLADLVVSGLVFIVPVAPFAVFGIVYNASRGMVPLVYVVGLVAMTFTAFSYVKMSRVYPIAGSVYTYASKTIGETIGFLAGWAILLDYILSPTLVYVACAIALQAVFPDIPKPLWVVLFLAFSTGVNILGIEAATRVNILLLVLQLIVLAIFMAIAAVAVANGINGAHFSYRPFFSADYFSLKLIFGALSIAVLSFLGFDAVSTLAEETDGGPKLVGTATVLSLFVAATLFIAQTYLACLFVLGRSSFPLGAATDGAFYRVAELIGGYWLKIMVSIFGMVLSGIPAALTAQAATARLLYGMARDGRLPRVLAVVNSKRGVPDAAVLLVALVTLVLGLSLVNSLELLTSMVSFGALVGFAILHLSVLAYQFKTNSISAKSCLSPAMGFLIICYVLLNTNTAAKVAGLLWLVVGILTLVVSRRRAKFQEISQNS